MNKPRIKPALCRYYGINSEVRAQLVGWTCSLNGIVGKGFTPLQAFRDYQYLSRCTFKPFFQRA